MTGVPKEVKFGDTYTGGYCRYGSRNRTRNAYAEWPYQALQQSTDVERDLGQTFAPGLRR